MHLVIDEEGNRWNVKFEIKNNKLYAIWDDVPEEINLIKDNITIKWKQ